MIENALRKQINATAYADEQAMLVRKHIHQNYTVPDVDFSAWVLERLKWTGQELVLDVGSGPATYLDAIQRYIRPEQYIAYDLSMGMLQASPSSIVKRTLGTVEALPYADQSFDVVMAHHTLHLIDDLDRAVREIQRVLRPNGLLIAATNSEFTMPEFNTLMQRAFRLLNQHPEHEMSIEQMVLHDFSLESAPVKLGRYFTAVARYDVPTAFVFRETQPVMDYITSARAFYEPYIPDGIIWSDFIKIMGDQVRRLVDHFGELVVNKLAGVVVATNGGGFASEYYQRLNDR